MKEDKHSNTLTHDRRINSLTYINAV